TNNPYSTSDDKMREDAKGRVEYWKGQHVNSKTAFNAKDYNEPVVGMEFVFVKGGEYEMGCWDWAIDCYDDEKPAHRVKVDDFYMGKYEVTVGQWKKFIQDTGYKGDGTNEWGSKGMGIPNFPQEDNHPVVCVSWNEAKAFADWLSGKTGKKCRLPTEAEWEYAARSRGQKVKYGTKTGGLSHDLANYAGTGGKDQWECTSPVGSFPANPLGLYDMTGNVWEWCSDWYGSDYYSNSPVDNPKGPGSGDSRVLRGISWYLNNPRYFRCGNRSLNNPKNSSSDRGFRVSRMP
ncbi:MAG TPA: formylglycine-generating enzyme family protein, partial [Candidatus Wunengus sp. YC63]|uniref:formylglycine-generating enzyme family protein n=1 Tax=Candidatus Wunengus sp. YC63 TaxID=3367699 RepID=UPI004027697A